MSADLTAGRTTASPVAEILSRYPAHAPAASAAGAAVFAVLRDAHDGVETLLIERTKRDGDPASGQVSLPGGHVDPTDRDLEVTALRELEEEIGLRRSDLVEPVRYVEIVEARRFSLSVGVFSAGLSEGAHPPSSGNPEEVAGIFWLPRRALSHRTPIVLSVDSGTIEVPSVHHDGHVVWGLTLRILDDLFRAAPERRSTGAEA